MRRQLQLAGQDIRADLDVQLRNGRAFTRLHKRGRGIDRLVVERTGRLELGLRGCDIRLAAGGNLERLQ